MHPDNPRRWLLVRREMGVPNGAGKGNWWFKDQLFLDQEGVATLVEVKRGDNKEIRRKVVGQSDASRPNPGFRLMLMEEPDRLNPVLAELEALLATL